MAFLREGGEPLQEYFFANYRLLTDDGIAKHESAKRLAEFTSPMPYTHTFTLRLGDVKELEEKLMAIGQAVYQQQQAQGGAAGAQPGADAGQKNDDGVVDAEIVDDEK